MDNLHDAFSNFVNLGSAARAAKLRQSVEPAILGTSIVMGVSVLERICGELMSCTTNRNTSSTQNVPTVGSLRTWQRHLGLDATWHGWQELGNFIRIRHCFAHVYGKVLQRHRTDLVSFRDRLQSGNITDEERKTVPNYYDIVNDEIILKPEALHHFRKLANSFIQMLRKKGYTI